MKSNRLKCLHINSLYLALHAYIGALGLGTDFI